MTTSAKPRVLTSAADIRSSIKHLLSDPKGERIIAVAFVGRWIAQLLPYPSAIKLYCWPQPGSTNPYGIEELVRLGVKVNFVDRLHCKIYWSENRGSIVGSANLTSNGLLDEGLTEAVALLPPKAFDVRSLLRGLETVPNFEKKLEWLHREHVIFQQKHQPPRSTGPSLMSPLMPYDRWVEIGRPGCVLAGYEDDCEAPKDALRQLEENTGSATHAHFYAPGKNKLKVGVFTLGFRVRRAPSGFLKMAKPFWWTPEIVVRTANKGWSHCPYIFFAKRLQPRGTQAPFDCTENRFRTALEKTMNEMPSTDWCDPYWPTARFWEKVSKHCLTTS